MPAGGFKTFSAGVLASADVNDYLMQGVLVFDSAATRDAGIGTAVEGMTVYTRDDDAVRVYDGSAWLAVSPTQGPRICGKATATINSAQIINVTIPSETVAGDLLVAVTATIGGSGESASGWTRRHRVAQGASEFSVLCVWTRVAVAADAGATAAFTVSSVGNTAGCGVVFSLHNPLEVTNVHGYDDDAGLSTALTCPAPTTVQGRKPLRFDVFAQYGNPVGSFSGYTGVGVSQVNLTSSNNRLQVFTKYDSGANTSTAALTSSASYNWTGASFRVKG